MPVVVKCKTKFAIIEVEVGLWLNGAEHWKTT